MKVIIKLEVSDEMRRAITFHSSRRRRPATRKSIRYLALGLLDADLSLILDEYRTEMRRRATNKARAEEARAKLLKLGVKPGLRYRR